MELLILIVGIVLVFKMSTAINSALVGLEAKSQNLSESMAFDAAKERAKLVKKIEAVGPENFKTHAEVMKLLNMDD